jgi:hypothetical protein
MANPSEQKADIFEKAQLLNDFNNPSYQQDFTSYHPSTAPQYIKDGLKELDYDPEQQLPENCLDDELSKVLGRLPKNLTDQEIADLTSQIIDDPENSYNKLNNLIDELEATQYEKNNPTSITIPETASDIRHRMREMELDPDYLTEEALDDLDEVQQEKLNQMLTEKVENTWHDNLEEHKAVFNSTPDIEDDEITYLMNGDRDPFRKGGGPKNMPTKLITINVGEKGRIYIEKMVNGFMNQIDKFKPDLSDQKKFDKAVDAHQWNLLRNLSPKTTHEYFESQTTEKSFLERKKALSEKYDAYASHFKESAIGDDFAFRDALKSYAEQEGVKQPGGWMSKFFGTNVDKSKADTFNARAELSESIARETSGKLNSLENGSNKDLRQIDEQARIMIEMANDPNTLSPEEISGFKKWRISGWLNRAKQFLQSKAKTARREGKAQSWLSRMGNRCRLSKLWDRGVCRSVTKKEDHTLSLPNTANQGAALLTGLSKTNTTHTDNAATRSNAVSKQSKNQQQQDGKRASP